MALALAGAGACTRPPLGGRVQAPRPPEGPEGELASLYGKLEGYCAQAPAVTPEERKDRLRRFQSEMKAMGIHAFVAEAGTQMEFLSGIRWGRSERPVLIWFEQEGPLRFVAPHFESNKLQAKLEALGGEVPVIDRWREHESAAAILGTQLPEAIKSVAVDPWMRNFVAQPVAALRSEQGDGQALVVRARARKTPVEIERMRWANKATKAAIAMASANLEFGMPQSVFASHLRAAQQAAGLSHIWVLSLFGPNASFPHGTADDRKLTRGDVVLVDTGGALHGYQSDVSRTFALAPVDKSVERAAVTVHAAQQAAMDRVAVGRTCGSVDAAARMVMRERGYGGSDRWFTHRLGHGIGVQVHEAPYMVPHSTQLLEAGMTFSVEPGIYVPKAFGVRIEDIVYVDEKGAHALGPRCSMDDFYIT